MRPAYFIRLERGETLEGVAEATGIGADTISLLERGETTRPLPKTLGRLAEHYGVSIRDLLIEKEAA